MKPIRDNTEQPVPGSIAAWLKSYTHCRVCGSLLDLVRSKISEVSGCCLDRQLGCIFEFQAPGRLHRDSRDYRVCLEAIAEAMLADTLEELAPHFAYNLQRFRAMIASEPPAQCYFPDER